MLICRNQILCLRLTNRVRVMMVYSGCRALARSRLLNRTLVLAAWRLLVWLKICTTLDCFHTLREALRLFERELRGQAWSLVLVFQVTDRIVQAL